MPPDSVPDVLHFAQPPHLSFRPIRAAIAAALGNDAAGDADDGTTDVCIAVACLADGNHLRLVAVLSGPPSPPDAERVLFRDLAQYNDVFRAEIAAIRAITNTLTAAGLALGFSADVVKQLIIDKQCRELFEYPEEQD